jgi:DNA-binding beta-propeller fold protein YncE
MSIVSSRRNLASALLAALALGGCAPRWSMRLARPEQSLQWPYEPARAKLTYVESFTGFARPKGSASFWRAVVHGGGKDDSNSFILPVGIAVGGDGRLAVADQGRRCVHLYLPERQLYFRLDGSKTEKIVSPVGVAFDEEMRLYLSDSAGKIFAFSAAGEFLYAVRKAGEAALQRPTGLAYSPRQKLLYVVDTLANCVHALRPGGELAFTFGRRGEEEGGFNFPTHIFWSPAGELYVTDSLDFRVEIFDEMGHPRGFFGHHGDGSGDLAMPKGIAVDQDGVIYVVDGMFDNVQLFDRRGTFLLTLGARGVGFGEFWLPTGATIGSGGELYVCDTYNHRIQVFRITKGYANETS